MKFNYNIEGFNNFLMDFENYQSIVEQRLLDERTEKFEVFEYTIDEFIKPPKDLAEAKKDFLGFVENNFEYIKKRQLLIDGFRKQTSFYSNSFRSSLLVQIFSVFEHELIKICNQYQEDHKTGYKIKDLKGNGDIEKAEIHLSKTCKVDFSNLNNEWSYINTIFPHRGCVLPVNLTIRFMTC